MRITGGLFKGRILKSVSGRSTRPTADKVKQAIFNILMHDIEDAVVLDLFAGTGALGIEALSRGAKEAVFVDSGYHPVKVIRENLKMIDLKMIVLDKKCAAACAYLKEMGRQFDLIFADPPYKEFSPIDIVELVAQYDLLTDTGLLIIEHELGKQLENKLLDILKNRKFGHTEISFFARKNENKDE